MSTKKPMVLCFAGPNGSGKSTISRYFDYVGVYTNADDIAAASGMSNEETAVYVYNKRNELINERKDFTFETVLSSEYGLSILRKAKEAGYFIKCFFVLTSDASINIARVRSRVELGGHGVEREKIEERYKKSLGNIKELLDICDILHIYDNSEDVPVRILRKHKDEVVRLFPTDLWSEESIRRLITGELTETEKDIHDLIREGLDDVANGNLIPINDAIEDIRKNRNRNN